MSLTKEQVMIEYVRCMKDTPYALRTYLETYDNTVSKYVPLELFPDQVSLLNDYENYNENIALKYRQAGVSTVTAAWISKKIAFAKKTKPEKILIIANKLDTSMEMANKIRMFITQWPNWVGIDFSVDKNSQKHYKTNNGCEVKAVATSKDALRGFTPTILVFDEAAFIDADSDFWAACMASLSTGGKVIVVSTPNGYDPIYYEIYNLANRGRNDFKISEMFWYRDPRYTKDLYLVKTQDIIHYLLNKEEYPKENIISWENIHFEERNFDELKMVMSKGYKPCSSWFEGMVKKLKYDKRKVSQELECSFLTSGDNVFDSNMLQSIKENMIKEPQNKMIGNSLWIWKEPIMGHKYVMGCLPPGEKVLTNFGLKNIEDVTFDDLLVNELGNYVNIINKQIYPVVDEDIYTIKVDNTFRTTTFTKEHPILISKPILKRNYKKNNKEYEFNERYWDFNFKYIKTEDIEVGDWIKVPNQYFNKKIENIDNYWKISEKVRTDFNISSPLNNKEFWWFIGMWLGDGWLEQKKDSYLIGICFDKKQKSYLHEMEKIILKLFDRNPSYIDKDSSDSLVFNSKFLYYFLLENFGRYSYGKMISEWVKMIPNEFKYELIRGYFNSDGCWVKVKEKDKFNSKISFVSVSLTLLESIQDILFSIGIISSLTLLRNLGEITFKNKLYKTKETYSLNLGNNDSLELLGLINNKDDIKLQKFNINEFSIVNKRIISSCHFNQTKEFIFFKVKNIKKNKFTGNVYNFECETNTFMCHHITTHNCDVSRGDSEDFSSFQIIDFDEREQVAEYVGKLPPDTMAEICYKWGNMYNCFIVIDITGGMGVSTSRKLQEMGYKNLYIDGVDMANKWKYDPKALDKIPGLNFNNKRVQIIASYEEAMRHEFKIYSSRLFNEMNTFVYINGRPDHQKGQHDDLIMSIAMATYVAESSFTSLEKVTEQTKAMLESWSVTNNESVAKQIDFNPVIPFGHDRIHQRNQNVTREDYEKYGWLFGNNRR